MRGNKLAGGLATAGLVIGLLGASSAGADPAPGKDACKNSSYQALGFANQGQCVKAANQAHKAGEQFPPGGGGEFLGGGDGGWPGSLGRYYLLTRAGLA